MKHGGQGGWRAVKRFNRDARVADRLPPYGYRTRYARSGRKRQSVNAENDQPYSLWRIWYDHPFLTTLAFSIVGPPVLVFWVGDKLINLMGTLTTSSPTHDPGTFREPPASGRTDIGQTQVSPRLTQVFEGQCEALTIKGGRCRNKATRDGLCSRHLNAGRKEGTPNE